LSFDWGQFRKGGFGIESFWVYFAGVEFRQRVLLERKPSLLVEAPAITWSIGSVGLREVADISRVLNDFTDEFTFTWVSVNSKK
jgi:hypothetical protein